MKKLFMKSPTVFSFTCLCLGIFLGYGALNYFHLPHWYWKLASAILLVVAIVLGLLGMMFYRFFEDDLEKLESEKRYEKSIF